MNCQGTTMKDVPVYVIVNNFELTYILFKFFFETLLPSTDYEFLPKQPSE